MEDRRSESTNGWGVGEVDIGKVEGDAKVARGVGVPEGPRMKAVKERMSVSEKRRGCRREGRVGVR